MNTGHYLVTNGDRSTLYSAQSSTPVSKHLASGPAPSYNHEVGKIKGKLTSRDILIVVYGCTLSKLTFSYQAYSYGDIPIRRRKPASCT
jgi:hypothetical protein